MWRSREDFIHRLLILPDKYLSLSRKNNTTIFWILFSRGHDKTIVAWCLTNSKVQVSITNTEAVPHTQGPFLVIYEPSYLTYKVYNASALTVSVSVWVESWDPETGSHWTGRDGAGLVGGDTHNTFYDILVLQHSRAWPLSESRDSQHVMSAVNLLHSPGSDQTSGAVMRLGLLYHRILFFKMKLIILLTKS